MNINMEIPAPSTPEKAVPIGYDIPRDTISRDFIKRSHENGSSAELSERRERWISAVSDSINVEFANKTRLRIASNRLLMTTPPSSPVTPKTLQ
ncbi:hypothetical protein OSTOST_15767 [Ostertagia ostertagi]